MKKAHALLAFVVALACESDDTAWWECPKGDECRADVIPLFVPSGLDAVPDDRIEYLEDTFGMVVDVVGDPYGAVAVFLLPPGVADNGLQGLATRPTSASGSRGL